MCPTLLCPWPYVSSLDLQELFQERPFSATTEAQRSEDITSVRPNLPLLVIVVLRGVRFCSLFPFPCSSFFFPLYPSVVVSRRDCHFAFFDRHPQMNETEDSKKHNPTLLCFSFLAFWMAYLTF